MTSQKQTDANRRNALLSTGPRTEDGKQQARGNAYRHGLTAETVIAGAEDAAEYAAFEAEIVGEFDPKSVVERELTRRLASLLWRLARANLIEAGLLSIYSETTPDREKQPHFARRPEIPVTAALIRRVSLTANCSDRDNQHGSRAESARTSPDCDFEPSATSHSDKQRALTTSFLRVANLNSQPLERISRYEASLWRQFVQVLFALDQAKYHRIAASRGRFTPHPPQW